MPQEHKTLDSDWDNERVTMGRHFLRDMEGLWSEVLKLAAVVEEALNQSIRSLRTYGGSPPSSRSMATWNVSGTWRDTSPSVSRSYRQIPVHFRFPSPWKISRWKRSHKYATVSTR